MRGKRRVLIFPNTDTLSHLARAFTLAAWLDASGYETHIGISRRRRAWAARFYARCHTVREIWEPSGMAFPCLPWFSDKAHVEACARTQEALIARIRPGLVIGIFDFVSALSARGIPRISINGACMLPMHEGVLGFDDQPSAARDRQQELLHLFWTFAGRAFHPVCARRGRALPVEARELLVGDLNLIYEIPHVCGVNGQHATCHCIGPLMWDGWERLGTPVPWRRDGGAPIVYLNAGTFLLEPSVTQLLIDAALATGARVLVSGRNCRGMKRSPRLFCRPFLAPSAATGVSELVICTGGAGVCYSNLRHGVPSLVVPMQPEQASNGLALERAGCGRIMARNIVFMGDANQYARAVAIEPTREVLHDMLDRPEQFHGLAPVGQALRAWDARERVLGHVRDLL